MDLVLDASGDHTDLHGSHQQPAQLGANIQHAVLRYDEKVAVCRVEGRIGVHGLPCRVDVHAYPLLHGRVSGPGHEAQTRDEVGLFVMVEGVPSQLVGDKLELGWTVRLVRCERSARVLVEWWVRT